MHQLESQYVYPIEILTLGDIKNTDAMLISSILQKIDPRPFIFQGKQVGGLEIHLGENQYYILKCKNGGRPERGNYGGLNGKNGIWKITKTSDSAPKLAGYFNDLQKFDVQMSDSVCTDKSWRSYWSRNVEKIKFVSKDKASVQYRKGNPRNL